MRNRAIARHDEYTTRRARPFPRVSQIAAIDLGPTGDPGADGQPQAQIFWLIVRQKRPWSDQRHVTKKHVEQLGEFVDARTAQASANE